MQKKILIVGGSTGLGRELVRQYHEKGWLVGVIARRENLLGDLKAQYPGIHIFPADISDPSIRATLDGALNSMKEVDLCLITASILGDETIDEDVIKINVDGFSKVLDFFWNYFSGKGSGQIAAVTSIAAARGNRHSPTYHASKAYQSLLMESLSVKAGYTGNRIIITELVAGYMDTAMAKGERLFWVSPLSKAAKQVISAIEKKRKRAFITRRWRFIFWGFRNTPWFIYKRIMNSGIKFKRE